MLNLRVSRTQVTDKKMANFDQNLSEVQRYLPQLQARNAWQSYETLPLVCKYYTTTAIVQAFSKWFTLHQFSIMKALYMLMRWQYTMNILRWPYQQRHQHNLPRVQRLLITQLIIQPSRMFNLRKNSCKIHSDSLRKFITKCCGLLLLELVNCS
jgi:hypothetical protein